MSAFALNIFLALVWAASTGQFTLVNLWVGFAIGYFVLALVSRITGTGAYVRRVIVAIGFVVFVAWEIIKANIRLLRDVLTGMDRLRPAFIAYPLRVETDTEIILLATIVAITPGTVVIDVSADRKVMYIHTLYYESREAFNHEIGYVFERRVLELLR